MPIGIKKALAVLGLLSSLCQSAQADLVNAGPDAAQWTQTIQDTSLYNRVRAIIHRWYQFYEDGAPTTAKMERQLALLTADFQIRSPLGNADSREEYSKTVSFSLPEGIEHAHHIIDLKVEQTGPNEAVAKMTTLYNNSASDNGTRSNIEHASILDYEIVVTDIKNAFPKFRKISLKSRGIKPAGTFQSARIENQVSGLVYGWLASLESQSADREQLTFMVHRTPFLMFNRENPLSSQDSIWAWYRALPQRVGLNAHIVKHLSYQKSEDGSGIEMYLVFDYKAVTPDHKPLHGITQHHWKLESNTEWNTEPLLKLRSLQVDLVEWNTLSFAQGT